MLFRQQAQKLLLLSLFQPRWNFDIVGVLGFLIFILSFFVNDQETREAQRRTRSAEQVLVSTAGSGHIH